MENIRKTLFWCMVMGFAVMLIWCGMIVFGDLRDCLTATGYPLAGVGARAA